MIKKILFRSYPTSSKIQWEWWSCSKTLDLYFLVSWSQMYWRRCNGSIQQQNEGLFRTTCCYAFTHTINMPKKLKSNLDKLSLYLSPLKYLCQPFLVICGKRNGAFPNKLYSMWQKHYSVLFICLILFATTKLMWHQLPAAYHHVIFWFLRRLWSAYFLYILFASVGSYRSSLYSDEMLATG